MQDLYEILQVHPKADQETIQAAYERLRERHDPAKLEGAAEELVALAQRKRADLDHAYAVLSDSVRRANYDAEQETRQAQQQAVQADALDDDEPLDYRPLPPARGKERPRGFDVNPTARRTTEQPRGGRAAPSNRKRRTPPWVGPVAAVAAITFVVILASLLLTDGGQQQYASDSSIIQAAGQNAPQGEAAVPSERERLFAEYDGQVVQAQQVVEQVPDNPEAWVRLGNALYDSVQVVRELEPGTETYAERIPRWLEASEAYATAVELGVEAPNVRSDMGVSLCYYGMDSGEDGYAEEGLALAREAAEESEQNGRVLLNLGICLVSVEPAQTEEAMTLWLEVLDTTASETGVSRQAMQLIEEYSR
jgi:curved DNA-binding protein CbpA